jgi:uncharacterized repeat protein (TIGR01451 family)
MKIKNRFAILLILIIISSLIFNFSLSGLKIVKALTTLSLTKGYWDIIGLDSNKPEVEGPYQFLIQIHIKNTGSEDATNVQAVFSWTSSNSYINLHPHESTTKIIDSIPAGQTKDVFYLVVVTRTSSAFFNSRSYSVTVSGTNISSITPNPITGNLYVEKLVSQARNYIISITPSSSNPAVGEIFTLQVQAYTATTYDIVTIPIVGYDPAVVEPISVSTTPPTPPTEDLMMLNTGGYVMTSTWTLLAKAPGITYVGPFIYDQSGSSFHYNGDYGEDKTTVTVTPKADLYIDKSISPSNATPGSQVTFTLTVGNNGPNTATNVKVVDILPSGYTYVSSSPSGVYNPITGIWTIGTLAKNATTTLTIYATVNSSGSYVNSATVSSDTYDPNLNNNTDQAYITLLTPALNIEKSDSPDPVQAGGTLTYTIEYWNSGNADATNVIIIDPIPSNTKFVVGSVTSPLGVTVEYSNNNGSTWTYTPVAGGDGTDPNVTHIRWLIVTLSPSTTHSQITFQVKVNSPLPNGTLLTNKVSIQSDEITTPIEDTETTTVISIIPKADLYIEKTIISNNPGVGETVVLKLFVKNNGPNTATNIIVTDSLPNSLSNFALEMPSQGNANIISGLLI